MRKKNPENMNRKELLEAATELDLQFAKNTSSKKLVRMINEIKASSLVEQPPVLDVEIDDDEPELEVKIEEPKPCKPVIQRRSWAGNYELLCDAKVNDGTHKKGEVVELSDEDARSLKAQGAIELG